MPVHVHPPIPHSRMHPPAAVGLRRERLLSA